MTRVFVNPGPRTPEQVDAANMRWLRRLMLRLAAAEKRAGRKPGEGRVAA